MTKQCVEKPHFVQYSQERDGHEEALEERQEVSDSVAKSPKMQNKR